MTDIATAIITGASSGIGRSIAIDLAQRGYRLGLIGRSETRLQKVAKVCDGFNGCQTTALSLDVRDIEGFGDFIQSFGPVDLFVSNAGILRGRSGSSALESGDTAREVLDVNLMASIQCLHKILPGMRSRRRGRIVLVSSLAGLAPLADAPAYSASKAGLVFYGLSLREALRDEGISVTVACPGYVATPMGRQHHGQRPHEIDAADAASRILKATLNGKGLCGFPFPLYPAAHLSLMIPAWLNRFFTRRLRFTVSED